MNENYKSVAYAYCNRWTAIAATAAAEAAINLCYAAWIVITDIMNVGYTVA